MGTQIIYMHKIIKKVQTYNVIILSLSLSRAKAKASCQRIAQIPHTQYIKSNSCAAQTQKHNFTVLCIMHAIIKINKLNREYNIQCVWWQEMKLYLSRKHLFKNQNHSN